ncbi:ParB/RepB/Spo0J family partition protein [bacterium]|nr:ParB/RepB/Spo0J family partition protein [bacterium]
MQKKALGKGLDALIPKIRTESNDQLSDLSLTKIDPNPKQPRRIFQPEHLEELAQSIKENGVLQPIVVHPRGDRYIIVFGERRVRAARMAGLSTIPALIRKHDDRDLLKYALIENIQREDLDPIEQALAFDEFMQTLEVTQEELAEQLGKDRSVIANTLRLLKLPTTVQQAIQKGDLSAGHARNLLALKDSADQIEVAQRIIRENWTVRQTEHFVQKNKSKRKIKTNKATSIQKTEPFIPNLREKLVRYLGTKVMINQESKGGNIVISFFDEDDLTRLITLITKK